MLSFQKLLFLPTLLVLESKLLADFVPTSQTLQNMLFPQNLKRYIDENVENLIL